MKRFKDCPDATILRYMEFYATNRLLAEQLRLLGYEDATEHKVRRRKRDLRRSGATDSSLVWAEPLDDEQTLQ